MTAAAVTTAPLRTAESGGVSSGGLKRVPIALLVKRVLSSKVTEKNHLGSENRSLHQPNSGRARYCFAK